MNTTQTSHANCLAKENWHSFEEDAVFNELDSSKKGLSSEEAQKRLERCGLNKLPSGKKITIWEIILGQILNPLIFILIIAAIASILIGEPSDAIFIFLVIFINSALGTYQEYNAEKSAASLQSLLKIKARVRRDNKETDIDSENLVLGDVVILESGLKVPADMRLFDATNLSIDESFLTGESIAAKKAVGILREKTGVSERTNIAFAGSTVMSGRGIGVVIGTGIHTQVGVIASNVTESASAKPPLVVRMEKFIKIISVIIIIISIFLGIYLRMQGLDLTAIFFFVVALAVSAIPEGLPIALTVALSIATKRMSKRNVIVRKLNSVESLGSCTVIASDKTGTLTVNQQTVKKAVLPNGQSFTFSGEGYNGIGNVFDDATPDTNIDFTYNSQLTTIAKISVMANEGSLEQQNNEWHNHGDAMDVALLGMSYKLGLLPKKTHQEFKKLDIIPYESEKKYSAIFCSKNNISYIGMKGAVETILGFCTKMANGDKDSFVDIDKTHILQQAESMAEKGYRVLAIAGGKYPDFVKKETYNDNEIPELTLFGLVGFMDPIRPEAKESVITCKNAGIKVIMITGDHPATAQTISQELGIAQENETVVTGQMLTECGSPDSPAYEKLVNSTHVFARVSPTQKLEIVDVLIRCGEFVAVTGDGVNDAPALKRANIGVAMGSGTDVAKEVGSMIITDDNFSSIVAGVEEGRFAYDNVRKVIYLLISTGAGLILLILGSLFAGLPLPLLAAQLLWLNLVTNGIQDVALAFEGGEPGAMKRNPRKPKEGIFNALMIKQTVIAGVTMGAIALGFWYWLITGYGDTMTPEQEYSARNLILLLVVFLQNIHVFNSRSELTSAFKVPLKRNVLLVFGVIVAQGIHILSMQIPFMQKVLKIEPIPITHWLYIFGLSIPLIIIIEIFKAIQRRKLLRGNE
jgi:magnesium-transporting ATPase (P-type)